MKKIVIGTGLLALVLAFTPQMASAASSAAVPPAAPTTPPMPPPPPAMAPAMMPNMGNHIDGELAFIKAELKITDSQEKAWNNFAKVATDGNKQITDSHGAMASTKVPDMLDARAKLLKTRLDVLEKLKDALDPLYADLTPEQKVNADQLIPMHLGMLIM